MADRNSDSESNRTSGAASAQRAKEQPSSDTYHRAKNSTEKIVEQAIGKVKQTAASIVDDQRGGLAAGITGIAESVRQIGENVNHENDNQIAALAGSYGNNLANQIERISNYVEEKEITEIAGDVEKFARRNPALFVGAAFALGILAARFLKSSASRKRD